MKMINNYILIENGNLSFYINKKEIQFLKYSNGMLYIKLSCSDEIESIPVNQKDWRAILMDLCQSGIQVKL